MQCCKEAGRALEFVPCRRAARACRRMNSLLRMRIVRPRMVAMRLARMPRGCSGRGGRRCTTGDCFYRRELRCGGRSGGGFIIGRAGGLAPGEREERDFLAIFEDRQQGAELYFAGRNSFSRLPRNATRMGSVAGSAFKLAMANSVRFVKLSTPPRPRADGASIVEEFGPACIAVDRLD